MKDTPSPILDGHWVHKNCVVTVHLVGTDSGYASEWWISSNFGGNLQVIGNYNFPIYGYSAEEALRKAAFHVETLCTFAMSSYGGEGTISVKPSPSSRINQAVTHLALHKSSGAFEGMTLLERTRAMYDLGRQFGVSKVAVMIANFEGVNVRTIHERLQRVRTSV